MSDSPVARFPKNGQGKPEQIAAAYCPLARRLQPFVRGATVDVAGCLFTCPTQTPKEALT
jgi:hypothetical protein